MLPEALPWQWQDWFSDKLVEARVPEGQTQDNIGGLYISEVLAHFPCALLITSLQA